MHKQVIPIFFAIDDKYTPFLKISLKSLMDNSSEDNLYKIYILNVDISESNQKEISDMLENNFECEFVNMVEKLKHINDKLFTRDYYSKTTYYRLFIANMFKEYDKAIYIDSDIIVRNDIANLFNYEIGDNLVGAVPDESVQIVPEFIEYVEKYLGIYHTHYFNAGVLVMNLSELRKFEFEEKFISLLGQIKFSVAQDQDYLNVLCKDRVYYLPRYWNKMPFPSEEIKLEDISLIHYNLTFKPWHHDDILYGEEYYFYAKKVKLLDFVNECIKGYTKEFQEKDVICGENLKKLAHNLSLVSDTYNYLLQQKKISF